MKGLVYATGRILRIGDTLFESSDQKSVDDK